jgi:hypothetical protein
MKRKCEICGMRRSEKNGLWCFHCARSYCKKFGLNIEGVSVAGWAAKRARNFASSVCAIASAAGRSRRHE